MLICYDVEFPELGRLLADRGVRILFVPFCTDTATGYNRVRYCSQARAIENECYVAIAGSVGNLPGVINMDIQYAQSAVFSPSDFSFPNQAIVSETTPNAEATLIADVDTDLLKELNIRGSVRNLRQRRHDLYQITLSAPGTVFTGASGTAASVTVTVAAAEESTPSEAVTVKVFAPFSLSAGT